MKKFLKDEKGLTLIEMLAVIVVGTIFMIIITNIHLLVQKQYNEQSRDASGLFDVTLAAKEITKEIRKNPGNIEIPNEHTIIFTYPDNTKVKYKFFPKENLLKKNGVSFVADISDVYIALEGQKVTLKIESKVETDKNINTEIIIR